MSAIMPLIFPVALVIHGRDAVKLHR